MSRPDDLRLYTVGDVEQRLQLSRAKVYDLIRTGKRFGAAGICSGTAQGDAIILENLQL